MSSLIGSFEGFKTRLDAVLHEKNKVTDFLAKIERATGIRRLYITLGFFIFLTLYLMFGYGAEFLCNFICFIYPAYASIKAIESYTKEDDTKWLTFWVIYAIFGLIEYFSNFILFWIPFYWLFKCAFLFWCFLPTTWNGSILLYQNFIRPVFLRHQNTIDNAFDVARLSISQANDLANKINDEIIRRTVDNDTTDTDE